MDVSKKTILFDGVCNLCNRSVQYIIKRDKNDVFRFGPLQGEIGKALVAERGIDTTKVDSIILIDPGVAYFVKSDAAIEIAKEIGGAWAVFSLFQWVPVTIRNFVYDIIAKYRYRWFGKKDQCMVPTSELKAKFLE